MKEIVYAALISYREARRRHMFEMHGPDFQSHEPSGDFTSFQARNTDEQEFIEAITRRVQALDSEKDPGE